MPDGRTKADGGEEAEGRRETAERRPDRGGDGQSDGEARMQSSDNGEIAGRQREDSRVRAGWGGEEAAREDGVREKKP